MHNYNWIKIFKLTIFFINFCKKIIVIGYKLPIKSFIMTFERPLSPHLSIQKKLLTAVFSIFHRITGIGLSVGSVLISIWIFFLAFSPNYFNLFQVIFSTFIFKCFFFIWTLAIFYHLFNGIRYLFWSFGKGMELSTIYRSGYIVIFFSLLSTILVWVF